ncbi:MAG: stage 0 sporulation family protein [Clostridia bacterium]|nr:stage 0 sporulation family protein [Clostridia bacterium]
MTEVLSVKFKADGRAYYFDPSGIKADVGDLVVVETARGIECATVCEAVKAVDDMKIVKPLKKVLRLADDIDKRKMEENRKKAQEAFSLCESKVLEHKLDMKLVDVEYAFDGSKILFYFTSEGRVDFRDLVKDLASSFHTRIELRQIGVRDEAKMLGGLGICGQPFCCARFLDDFQPVSIKMAKEQGLSLNPTKISGSCGRLMCCLKYEQDAYEYLNSITPPVGSYVKTPSGNGTVVDENPLTGTLYVRIGEDAAPIKIHRSEVEMLSKGKNKKPKAKPANENEG